MNLILHFIIFFVPGYFAIKNAVLSPVRSANSRIVDVFDPAEFIEGGTAPAAEFIEGGTAPASFTPHYPLESLSKSKIVDHCIEFFSSAEMPSNDINDDKVKTVLIDGCKNLFGKHDHVNCDRIYNHMTIQQKIKMHKGENLIENHMEFCILLVETALPIEQEPACMRFMEDVSLRYAGLTGALGLWNKHYKDSRFQQAYEDQCNFENDESPGLLKCDKSLTDIETLLGNTLNAVSLSDFCDWIGLPLPHPQSPNTPDVHGSLLETKRGKITQAFRAASKHKHPKKKKLQKKKNGTSLMEGWFGFNSVSEAERHIQNDFNYFSANCREDRSAYVEEYSFEISVIGGYQGAIAVEGFGRNPDGPDIYDTYRKDKWWETCEVKIGAFGSHCVCAGLDVGIDVGISLATFNGYGDISGCSHVVSGEICIFFCFQYSSIYANSLIGGPDLGDGEGPGCKLGNRGSYIGNSWGAGFGMGLDISTCACRTTLIDNEYVIRTHIRGKHASGGGGGGCFPGDALVHTANGIKKISAVMVGEFVMTVDESGKSVFEEVYFFGHADHQLWSQFVVINLKESKLSLKLTEKHFVPTCPNNKPCEWTQRIYKYAKNIQHGDYVWAHIPGIGGEEDIKSDIVLSIDVDINQGLFNPYTMSGNIVVDGMLVSSHSDWILDALIPEKWTKYIPSIYQTIFFPARLLFRLSGSYAYKIANIMGFGNPNFNSSSKTYLTVGENYDMRVLLTGVTSFFL